MRFIYQLDRMDCGPACLCMVASKYGKKYSLQYLRENSFLSREGVSLSGMREASQKIGFEVITTQQDLDVLQKQHDFFPCILHWNSNHFVVLLNVKKNIFTKKISYEIADPAHGIITLNEDTFKKGWLSDENNGIVLFLTPTEEFYSKNPVEDNLVTLKHVISYLKPYRKQFATMFLLLLIGSCITLVFPFLTQQLIDKGVNAKNLHFITIILLAQLGLFVGSSIIEIIRNWIMLFIGTKISITIISDFLKKLLQLPIKFFETKMIGDFNQRIKDNEKIDSFLTSQSITTLFSIITFSVFFGVLWYYDFKILFVYFTLTGLAVGWSYYWLRKRKSLDYFRFQNRSENQESIYEILNGVTEMKLNQFEDFKRKEWEVIQQKLFKINIRILKLDQVQLTGFEFINQLKNILVTFFAATYVVKGSMTLGELLSVSYIIGQMNSPVNQLISFFRSLQDAKLSLERLNEVQNHAIEERESQISIPTFPHSRDNSGISLKNVYFQYESLNSPYILKNINLFIPKGKITAIVGASGSGKTTLMKMLLKFYEPTGGEISFNSISMDHISPNSLRENCGVVMQDGFIFSDSIKRNIVTGDENICEKKLKNAIEISNINGFIESLPLKYNTKIGTSGNGISGGQKQRILIARAVYKDPHYLFFDEATSALDAENEKVIHENLQQFFKGKTVLIIAHRLSTVKNADQIVVLKNGEIVETGSHNDLVRSKGDYYNLIKNQLELGN
ncbi:peptidase domain-containing ABC transporter [Pedobacter cryoconitis]|uniref:peptidase domain-containing ABC transporter n=1 Tax=Pedobacter cryoconitis TaxID=188932 RepID=UPI0016146733|nr:peptidase domain-containing ABC transporter [Pedobacter cryoconitis]MBB5644844.1 ATP-binding cassette subfamily B protein [Pedobacter cryoconitis]